MANHLNDISKDHPNWLLDWVDEWDLGIAHTAWIVKRGARSLIKEGHPRSFALFGFESNPKVGIKEFCLSEKKIFLGEELTFAFRLRSEKQKDQKLVLDYKVYYVKKSGKPSAKVFKLKEVVLKPGEDLKIAKKHAFKDLSTRKHYPGVHRIELMINGRPKAEGSFDLISQANIA